MRRLSLPVLATVLGGTLALLVSATSPAGSLQGRWAIRELGTPVGHPSEASGVNAAG